MLPIAEAENNQRQPLLVIQLPFQNQPIDENNNRQALEDNLRILAFLDLIMRLHQPREIIDYNRLRRLNEQDKSNMELGSCSI